MSREAAREAKLDARLLFALLHEASTFRTADITPLARAARGDPKAEESYRQLVRRLDRMHALLFEAGATDIEPEPHCRRELAREGLLRRELPEWVVAEHEAGDQGAEE